MYEEIALPRSVKEQFDLTAQVVLITGGAGFLGLQYAEAIAEMGGIPVLMDLKREHLDQAISQLKENSVYSCGSYVVDVTNEENCRDALDQIIAKYGKVDVLINNAALTKEGFSNASLDYFAPFEDSAQELWEDGLRVNLTGTEIMCKLTGPIMVNQQKGSIINIASDVGVISPDHRIYQPDEHGYKGVPFNIPASYAVSKAGVIQLTRYLATYWAPYNVRVNVFSPAGVYRGHDPAFVQKLSTSIPLGRMALPNEYKSAIVFLASDASTFMTGHNLVMDGGRTCW